VRGIELSRSAGVLAVGDIAGAMRMTPPAPPRASTIPLRVMREMGMAGVSFLEFFAIGAGRDRFRQWLPQLLEEELRGSQDIARIGLQPHAPNTVCLAAYRWAREFAGTHRIPLCTHLAESPEERRFIADASGPMRELLERLGLWDESVAAEIGRGVSPVAHVAGTLREAGPLVAHVNDATDADLDLIRAMNATVVYCPHASEYLGAAAHFGPHRYRDMLQRGIPVALGTDSLVNLPVAAARAPDDGGTGLSIFEEMRLLVRRDGTESQTLLAMATVNGACALGLSEKRFVLAAEAEIAGLVGVAMEERGPLRPTPLDWALRGTQPARLLLN
jgi:cytosine/adenosine deaminase-related metal-dependent hydrolase